VIGHAVLHSDAATERCDTVDGLVGNRLGVIEEPVQACSGISWLTRSKTSNALLIVSSSVA